MEYAGEQITADEGSRREETVSDASVFRYFFRHKNKEYW